MLRGDKLISPGGRWGHERSRQRGAAYVAPGKPVEAIDSRPLSSLEQFNSLDETDSGPSARSERHVFTFRRWHVHRNTNERYMRHISGVFTSITWRNLTPPMTSLTAIAIVNGCYQTLNAGGYLPAGAPSLQLSDGPLELTSFALSLLLVFRTDSSYSRWTEALDVWSKVRNTSKDIVRDAVCWIKDPSLLSAIVRWTLAYAYSLKVYLRENGDISAVTQKLLLPHEHQQFTNLCRDTRSAYPQYALHVLTQAVARAGLVGNREERLLLQLATLNTCVGSCEKLLRYPIPLSYTRHTSRFMIIWLAFLPLALWDDAGWVSVPITTMISFLLLGIEEIGVAIEEPFALLPVRDIVKDIEKDLWAITSSRQEVAELLDLSLSLSAGETLNNMIEQAIGGAPECGPCGPMPTAMAAPVVTAEDVQATDMLLSELSVAQAEASSLVDLLVDAVIPPPAMDLPAAENVLFDSMEEPPLEPAPPARTPAASRR